MLSIAQTPLSAVTCESGVGDIYTIYVSHKHWWIN
jgi:hypothetical protein